MADYLESIEGFAVFPNGRAGLDRAAVPDARPRAGRADRGDPGRLPPPRRAERDDWQHPGFLAYFGTTASGPGILGEMLTAAIGQNAMLWRTSPIATELEGVVVGWLRQAFGLPEAFEGS